MALAYVQPLDAIIEAADNIMDYTQEMTKDQFMKNEMTMDAVVVNLERMGRATRKIPKSVQKEHKEIPWDDLYRNAEALLKEYDCVDYDDVWDRAKNSVPEIRKQVQKIQANKSE